MNLNSKFIKKIFLLLCIAINLTSTQSFAISTAIDVAKYGYKGIKALLTAKKVLTDDEWKEKLSESIKEIHDSTIRIETLLTSEANRVIEELSVKFDLQLMRDFVETVHIINQRYEKKFIKYNLGNDTYQPVTIERYINETIGETNFKNSLNQISHFIVPMHYLQHVKVKRLFDVLLDYYKIKANHHRGCNEASSNHQQLFAVYNLAVMTISRGYTMIVHAYKYKQQQSTSANAWEPEIRDIVEEYGDTLLSIARVARNAMNQESKVINRCEPKQHIENVTYRRLKSFLGLYLTSQDHMSSAMHCSNSCSSFTGFSGSYSRRYTEFGCRGTAYDCWETSVVQICPGLPGSGRRFEALQEYAMFKHYPKGVWSDRCDKEKLSASDVISRDPMCNICACTCDDWQDSGVRSFSLKEQYTNVSDNRVITGIRFNEVNGTIGIEIQEGQLINGSIDTTTVQWNPNASYSPKNGSDTVRLQYNWRSLNLDDIILPVGSLVTGVKFVIINDRLSLMVAGLPFYDETGRTIENTQNEMTWYSSTQTNRRELKLSHPDIPTRVNSVNVEISESGEHFIKFQLSDWQKDASQTVVPYLDSQEIITSPSTPLGGVGIYYKSVTGSGGFVALKLISANYTIHMSDKGLSELFNDN